MAKCQRVMSAPHGASAPFRPHNQPGCHNGLSLPQAEAEQRQRRIGALQGELNAAAVALLEVRQQLAAALACRPAAAAEVAALKGQAREQGQLALRYARELDEGSHVSEVVQAEVAGLRKALAECSSRHAEQVNREREEASETLRHLRGQGSAVQAMQANALSGIGYGPANCATSSQLLEELLSEVRRTMQAAADTLLSAPRAAAAVPASGVGSGAQLQLQAPGAAEAGVGSGPVTHGSGFSSQVDGNWFLAVVAKIKAAVIEMESRHQSLTSDAHDSRIQIRVLNSRFADLTAAHEARTAEWQRSEVCVHQLQRLGGRRSEQAAVHALEVVGLQDRRLACLQQQLAASTTALAASSDAAAAAAEQLGKERASVAALQRHVEVARAEKGQLVAQLGAVRLEAAGSLHVLSLGAEAAVAQRDVDVQLYFEREVTRLLLLPGAKDTIMALTREVCSLKLVESQLQASLAAAHKLSDASTLTVATLSEAIRAAEEQQLRHGMQSPAGSGLPLVAAVQLGSDPHAMFSLQEKLLKAQQCRVEGAAALLAVRERLSEAHDVDRGLLLREMAELGSRGEGARRAAAQGRQPPPGRHALNHPGRARHPHGHLQSHARRAAAPARDAEAAAADAQRDAARAARERKALAAQLQQALSCCAACEAELSDVREVTERAVAGLQSMLERVERAAGLAAVAAPGGGGGARRVPVASTSSRSTAVTTVVDDSSLGLAGLSKELVRSKLAEAEAHRRLRVAARSEVELRQVLLQRDERITQLKLQHANGGPRGRTSHSHDFTTSALLRLNAPVSGSARSPSRSHSASPLHPRSTAPAFGSTVAAAAAAATLPSCLTERPEPSWAGFGSDADAGATAAESVVAALQRQLEGRDEDVRTLEAMLARANESATASRLTHQTSAPPRHHHTSSTLPPPPLVPSLSQAQHDRAVTERLRDRLAAANGSLAAAIAVAHALLRRLGNSSSSSSGSSSSHIQLQQQQLLQADTTALPATLNLAMANLESRIHKIQSTQQPSPLEAAAAGAASAGSSAPLPSSSGANALLQHQQQLLSTFNDKENGSRNKPISDNVATELVQLREQHELVLLERDSQAAQLASCELSLRLLQQQMAQQGAEDRAVQIATLSGSSHTVSLLQHSIATLHMCCGRMEGAAAGVAAGSAAPITAVASMGAEAGAVAHELCLLDTTLGLLGRQLGNAMRAPDEAAALAAAEADSAAAAAAAAQLHGCSDWPQPSSTAAIGCRLCTCSSNKQQQLLQQQ
ncbi:MAG: hypothetical protein WDW38_010237 [Sanguina aurantia]